VKGTRVPLRCGLAALLAASAGTAWPDTIVLTNGRVIEADRAWYQGTQLYYERGGAVFGLPRSLVKSLEQAATPEQAPSPEIAQARQRLDAGDTKQAMALVRSALQRDPRSVPALQLSSAISLALGDTAAAKEAALKAVRLDDRDPRSFSLLGDALVAALDTQGALAAYRASVKLRPDAQIQKKLESIAPANARPAGPQFRLRYDGIVNEPLGIAVLRVLTDAFGEYEKRLGFAPSDAITVTLQTEADFLDTQGPDWAQGLNDGSIRLPVRGLTQPTPRLAALLRHELAHSFLAAQTGGNCPTWLQEGVAQWLEGGDPAREDAALAQRAREGRLLALLTLEAPFQGIAAAEAALAYAESLSGTAHLLRLRGEAGLLRLVAALRDGLPSEEALPVAVGLSYAEFERSWEQHLKSLPSRK